MKEKLAEYAHDAWSRWMSYLFYKSTHNEDGTVTIPKWAVERWSRQACTKYDSLPESEKTSDRDEADKILEISQFSIQKDKAIKQAQRRVIEKEQQVSALMSDLDNALQKIDKLEADMKCSVCCFSWYNCECNPF